MDTGENSSSRPASSTRARESAALDMPVIVPPSFWMSAEKSGSTKKSEKFIRPSSMRTSRTRIGKVSGAAAAVASAAGAGAWPDSRAFSAALSAAFCSRSSRLRSAGERAASAAAAARRSASAAWVPSGSSTAARFTIRSWLMITRAYGRRTSTRSMASASGAML